MLIRFSKDVGHRDFEADMRRNKLLHKALGYFTPGPTVNFRIKPWLTTGAYDLVITLNVSATKAKNRKFLKSLQNQLGAVTSKVDIVVGSVPVKKFPG